MLRFSFRTAVGVSVLGLAAGRVVAAQNVSAERVDSMITSFSATNIRIAGPQSVVFDPQTKTAKVRLFNPTNDTAVATVSTRFAAPGNTKPMLAERLLSEDSAAADSVTRDSLRTDSLGKLWSLASWIKESLPTQIWLAPHQTVVLTLHCDTPPSVKAGEYSAHLVVETMLIRETPTMSVNFGGGATVPLKLKLLFSVPESVSPRASAKLLYRAGGM